MKSDRELLRLAYKVYMYGANLDDNKDMSRRWNPLENDADAMRLIVACLPFYVMQYSRADYEYCKQDSYAATRRAAVRAVAEIGEMMS